MSQTRSSQILMKLGIHVVWEPTAPNPKILGQSDQWCGRYGPPNFESFGKNGHGCQTLNPHISGTSDPIFIKLVLMDRQFYKDSKYVIIVQIGECLGALTC